MIISVKKKDNKGVIIGVDSFIVDSIKIMGNLIECRGGQLPVPLYIRNIQDSDIDIVIMGDKDAY